MKRFLLYIFCFIFILLILFFCYMIFSQKNIDICRLKNSRNICYINAVIQSLYASDQFKNFIKLEKNNSNSKIKNLSRLFYEIEKNNKLDPIKYYEKIFKDSKLIKLDGNIGYFSAVFYEIIKLINRTFPENNLFFKEQDIKQNDNRKSEVMLIPKKEIFIEDLFIKFMSLKTKPSIIIFDLQDYKFNNSNHNFKINEKLIYNEKDKNISYNLINMICKTKIINKYKTINHVFVYSLRNYKWYKIDDDFFEKIDKNKILSDKSGVIVVYERV